MAAPSTRWPIAGGEKFDAWFFRACHRSPAERWRSVSEQIAALAEVLRDSVRTGGAGAVRGASVVTVHQALQQASGAGLPAGVVPAFGMPTPESRTASIARTPLRGELPRASRASIAPSAGRSTMAPSIGTSDAEDIEAMRPRSRKLAIGLGAGLATGLALVYVLVQPGPEPTAATPSQVVVAPVASSVTASPTGEKATSLSDPLPASVDAGAARTVFEDFEAPRPARGVARPDVPGQRRAPPPGARRPQPQSPPAPRAPDPNPPPQDDPLAP